MIEKTRVKIFTEENIGTPNYKTADKVLNDFLDNNPQIEPVDFKFQADTQEILMVYREKIFGRPFWTEEMVGYPIAHTCILAGTEE